jgi:hypothetical protein
MKTYFGKIRLMSGGHAVDVKVNASSPEAAKKIVESQYTGQLKAWVKHMASN